MRQEWTLGAWKELQMRFNKVLEDHIRDSLNILVLQGTRTVYDNPNESAISTALHFSRPSQVGLRLASHVDCDQ